jgi:hypothetical protein
VSFIRVLATCNTIGIRDITKANNTAPIMKGSLFCQDFLESIVCIAVWQGIEYVTLNYGISFYGGHFKNINLYSLLDSGGIYLIISTNKWILISN